MQGVRLDDPGNPFQCYDSKILLTCFQKVLSINCQFNCKALQFLSEYLLQSPNHICGQHFSLIYKNTAAEGAASQNREVA